MSILNTIIDIGFGVIIIFGCLLLLMLSVIIGIGFYEEVLVPYFLT